MVAGLILAAASLAASVRESCGSAFGGAPSSRTRPEFYDCLLRGAREEDWFNHLLTQAGVTVWDVDPDTKQQFRVEAVGGHFGGSLDGVLMGLIEARKYRTSASKRRTLQKVLRMSKRKASLNPSQNTMRRCKSTCTSWSCLGRCTRR